MIFNNKKESLLTYLLFAYIGGAAFYIGIATSSLGLTPAICAVATYFIGHYVFEYIIVSNKIRYKNNIKLVNVLISIGTSLFISYAIVGVSRFLYNKELVSFYVEPFSFGFIYGVFYIIYLKLAYTNVIKKF